MHRKDIIYSINVEDLQFVANEELNRDLTKTELVQISENLPNYFNWYDCIKSAIEDYLVEKKEV